MHRLLILPCWNLFLLPLIMLPFCHFRFLPIPHQFRPLRIKFLQLIHNLIHPFLVGMEMRLNSKIKKNRQQVTVKKFTDESEVEKEFCFEEVTIWLGFWVIHFLLRLRVLIILLHFMQLILFFFYF